MRTLIFAVVLFVGVCGEQCMAFYPWFQPFPFYAPGTNVRGTAMSYAGGASIYDDYEVIIVRPRYSGYYRPYYRPRFYHHYGW